MSERTVTAALIIIGNEILSGPHPGREPRLPRQELNEVGIQLREVRVVPDAEADIVEAVNALRAALRPRLHHRRHRPDPRRHHLGLRRQGVRRCPTAGIPRPSAASWPTTRRRRSTPARMKMAETPEGAELIDNPVSVAPGFTDRQRPRPARRAVDPAGDVRRIEAAARRAAPWCAPRPSPCSAPKATSPRRWPRSRPPSHSRDRQLSVHAPGRFGTSLVLRSVDEAAIETAPPSAILAEVARARHRGAGPVLSAAQLRYSPSRTPRPLGGIGRRTGLKIPSPQGRAGSSPAAGTSVAMIPANTYVDPCNCASYRLRHASAKRSLLPRTSLVARRLIGCMIDP